MKLDSKFVTIRTPKFQVTIGIKIIILYEMDFGYLLYMISFYGFNIDKHIQNIIALQEMLGSLLIEYEETERARKQLYVHVVQNIRHEYMAINKIELETVRRQCETRVKVAFATEISTCSFKSN